VVEECISDRETKSAEQKKIGWQLYLMKEKFEEKKTGTFLRLERRVVRLKARTVRAV